MTTIKRWTLAFYTSEDLEWLSHTPEITYKIKHLDDFEVQGNNNSWSIKGRIELTIISNNDQEETLLRMRFGSALLLVMTTVVMEPQFYISG
jgi:hypothetical protein